MIRLCLCVDLMLLVGRPEPPLLGKAFDSWSRSASDFSFRKLAIIGMKLEFFRWSLVSVFTLLAAAFWSE